MLDTIFKNGAGRKQANDELRDLVTQARDEREALGAMLAKMNAQGLLHKCETLATMVGGYDERAKGFQQLQARMSSLLGQVAEAKQSSEALTAPNGALALCRQAVDELNARAREAQATVVALREETAKFEEQRARLRQATAEVGQSAGAVAALKGDLEGLRRSESQLNQELQGIREGAREARDHSAAATQAVQGVQDKLQSFTRLQELSENTEQRLAALNALAEHVSHKAKALETQKSTVERAVVEATRLNEMVWNMDAQIARLTQGR
ncbi:MAG TPA: hypothetical protein VLJ62_33725, partial [Burkholderiaceae bacterium]|nr:hypothetical protein [Burkholderiaceae bacterium]